jgi:rRNA processing protein Krr1/Pno1
VSKSALKRQKLKAAAAKKEPTNILLATNSAVAAAVDNDDGWEVQASRKPRKTKAPAVEQTTMPEEENGPPKVDLQLEIPSKFYGTLIGSKGATLNLIQEGTGCRIDIPKKDEGEIVKITGSTEGIQRAKATIESLIKTGFSPITHPGMSKNEISVEEKLRPRLVGKKAQNLHALQDATNTVINLPQQGKGNKVSIIGTPQDIAQCKALIKQLLTDGYCPATHPGYMKVEMPFPRDRFGILIGPNGGTIKHITNSTGCQLNIPNATDLNQNLTLVGTAEGISQAQKHIKAVLEKEEAAKAAQRASLEEEEEYWKVDESALLDVW